MKLTLSFLSTSWVAKGVNSSVNLRENIFGILKWIIGIWGFMFLCTWVYLIYHINTLSFGEFESKCHIYVHALQWMYRIGVLYLLRYLKIDVYTRKDV